METVRRRWEARWGQPSRGNPLFEGVSLIDHLADLESEAGPALGGPFGSPEETRAAVEEDRRIMDDIDRAGDDDRDPFADVRLD